VVTNLTPVPEILVKQLANMPIPVAAHSRMWVCGRSLAGITGSIPAAGGMAVSYECCVLSGRGLYVGLITRPEESYRVWCILSVIVKVR